MTTTTTAFEKSIRCDRETRDFAMYLDGELVGYARTYHEAEVALDTLVYDLLSEGQCATAQALDGGSDPDACAAEVAAAVARPETAMVAIDEPGLIERNIQVWPYSTAEIVKHDPADSANTWYALLVDGRHHNLVMWKHTLGRPQHMEALNRALAAVQAAIDALNPQADPPADPGPEPWPSIFRPVVAPRLLDEADAVLTAPATAERFSVTLRNRRACILCGGNHSAEHCPRIRCANCDGPHSIQQCPAIRAALFAPSCPRCGGRHALADCPQRGPAETGGMLTSQGPLASRCRIEPADDNLEYLGFLDGVLVGIYSTVMTADLALANLAWASDHGLIARIHRRAGAAVLDRIAQEAGTVCTNCGQYGHSAYDCPYAPLPLPAPRPIGHRIGV